MPNVYGQVTTGDVRKMRELREEKLNNAQIARAVGVSQATVTRYIGPFYQPDHVTFAARRRLSGLRLEAQRYTAFVERAALFGCPVLAPTAAV